MKTRLAIATGLFVTGAVLYIQDRAISTRLERNRQIMSVQPSAELKAWMEYIENYPHLKDDPAVMRAIESMTSAN